MELSNFFSKCEIRREIEQLTKISPRIRYGWFLYQINYFGIRRIKMEPRVEMKK